ncbi:MULTISPECIES: hypothetical protein [unclassified Brachybacterium]|uniref:hypothetical protein n=1 Tax=unclassified Brachybacterium TaxID=2623841 RepID=UPI0040333368
MDESSDQEDAAGEAVCWIGLLCPECGAMPEGDGARDPSVPCWRCGAVRPTDPGAGPTSPGAGPTDPVAPPTDLDGY